MFKDFRAFIAQGNMIDLAVAQGLPVPLLGDPGEGHPLPRVHF